MLKPISYLSPKILAFITAFAIAGCNPAYNWREVRGSNAPFVVLLPGKPSTHTRQVNLDGLSIMMTMTATEVEGVTFAVGTAALPDHASPHAALNSMKTAMVRNINGNVRHEKSSFAPDNAVQTIDLEAVGVPTNQRGKETTILFARFAEKDRRIYQAVVLGKEKAVTRDAVDTFLTSFKLN